MMDHHRSQNLQECHGHGYLNALEEERRKIEMFQRELPLCLDLVTRAIEGCKRQVSGGAAAGATTTGQSECSEETTSDGPAFEEFMPIKRSCSPKAKEEEDDDGNGELESHSDFAKSNVMKSDWLRSVQLWNQPPDLPSTTKEIKKPTNLLAGELKRNGGAFQPFKKEKTAPAPAASDCSSAEEAAAGRGRKSRRCWSPELHRRFLNALQQLGGSHVATPKQIKELMKVDGLTNDEVKSHLQKYRLHTRRPTAAVHSSSQKSPRFVVVGGVWVPPPPEPAGDVSLTTTAKLAPPCPAGLPCHQESQREKSPSATSSSTHTTTSSQP